MTKQKAVVIYSGGMDSFTLLNKIVREGYDVYALTFNYGQKQIKEVEAASIVCKQLNVAHKVLDISPINQLMQSSSLIGEEAVPEGHYESESMKSTVVPNRNMILLSLAIGYAVDIKAGKVYYGAHAGDHAIYPDCRPEFVNAMNTVAGIANYEHVSIETPYLNSSKGDILTDGLKMGLTYENTWTCYNGRAHACGKCGACTERLEAFTNNNLIDPLQYEA
ncbi:MAG: 7-cyano-7-deazaguanine synthase [Crocinitomicaceae bacterium]|jgi:7-cyano-7-deazaguanine synthase